MHKESFFLPLEEELPATSCCGGREEEGGVVVMVDDPMLVAYLSGWSEGGDWMKQTMTGPNDGTERTGQGYWGTQTHMC